MVWGRRTASAWHFLVVGSVGYAIGIYVDLPVHDVVMTLARDIFQYYYYSQGPPVPLTWSEYFGLDGDDGMSFRRWRPHSQPSPPPSSGPWREGARRDRWLPVWPVESPFSQLRLVVFGLSQTLLLTCVKFLLAGNGVEPANNGDQQLHVLLMRALLFCDALLPAYFHAPFSALAPLMGAISDGDTDRMRRGHSWIDYNDVAVTLTFIGRYLFRIFLVPSILTSAVCCLFGARFALREVQRGGEVLGRVITGSREEWRRQLWRMTRTMALVVGAMAMSVAELVTLAIRMMDMAGWPGTGMESPFEQRERAEMVAALVKACSICHRCLITLSIADILYYGRLGQTFIVWCLVHRIA